MKNTIPILDNCSIDLQSSMPLLIDRISAYVKKYSDMVFPHKHNFYHLVLFCQGSGAHIIDFKHFDIVPGQFYIMMPGQVHTWKFAGDEDGFIINFSKDYFQSFLLRIDYLSRFFLFNDHTHPTVLLLKEKIYKKSLQIMEEIYQAKELGTDEDYIRIRLLDFFWYLEDSDIDKSANETLRIQNTLFNYFQKLVEQNYLKLRFPSDYAEQLCITPNHLNAVCKSAVGQSAGEIIRNRITLEAKRLLINKALNVNQIADQLLFNDNSYFTKFFRKYTGQTPDEFRKSQQL